jgi:hypothetical protein
MEVVHYLEHLQSIHNLLHRPTCDETVREHIAALADAIR